jgi:uridine kinase
MSGQVIGISSVSGDGKTTLTKRLAELLHDAVTLCFDDYDDTNIHPADRQAWMREGADYNAWETPVLTRDLQLLKSGNSITSPIDGSRIPTAKFIVFDAPLGRAHLDTGRFIDFMVFIDSPLDVAMARRLLRDLLTESGPGVDGVIADLKVNLSSYLSGGRAIYLEFQKQIKRTSDLILDGCLPVDELAAMVYMRIKQYKSSQSFT